MKTITIAFVAVFIHTAIASANSSSDEKEVQVEVAGVLFAEGDGHVVILKTKAEPVRYLPIFIGEMEALIIRMRIQRQNPPRPLTLYLLESVLNSSKTDVVRVKVDGLNGGIFVGSVTLKQGKRTWKVDARPSDAIGLAAGKDIPIWVSESVLDKASISTEELKSGPNPESKQQSYEETL